MVLLCLTALVLETPSYFSKARQTRRQLFQRVIINIIFTGTKGADGAAEERALCHSQYRNQFIPDICLKKGITVTEIHRSQTR